MPIEFTCPSCAKKYRVKDELAGKTAKCADCTTRIRIPAATAAKSATASAPQKAAASKPSAPTRSSASAPPAAAKPAEAGLSSWFDEELAAAPTAAVASKSAIIPPAKSPTATSVSGTCPSCKKPLKPGAVVCVACGFHTKQGKKLETAKGDDEPAQKSSALGATASFGRGALFSAIGALIGAGIWAGVAIGTGYEIGWIAWGLGGLAGLGMAYGHEDNDGTAAGITAAGISIVGILAAKFFIYQNIESMIAEAGVSLEMVEKLTGETISFAAMFSPMDGLFILLAVGTAYKLGSGQATD